MDVVCAACASQLRTPRYTKSNQLSAKNGSLIAALSSGIAICPSGVMVLSEVALCAS